LGLYDKFVEDMIETGTTARTGKLLNDKHMMNISLFIFIQCSGCEGKPQSAIHMSSVVKSSRVQKSISSILSGTQTWQLEIHYKWSF